MQMILLITGIIFLLYFISIAFFVGHGTNFYFIWLFLAVGAVIISLLMKWGIWAGHVPAWIRRCFGFLVCAGGILFVIVEGCILTGFAQKAPEGLDYLVVLGAQMKTSGPSKALQYRLDKAYEYLMLNPKTIVIVSGGKGVDEPMSEAQGMHEYLVKKGLAQERILMEDKSINTFQNLSFSAKFLSSKQDKVGIVTNNFHVYRAVKIAKRIGYTKAYGIAAKGEPFLQLNNMMREFFGVSKDFLVGNM